MTSLECYLILFIIILMATRIKDWEVPYTWWTGIEITENHVINVLLREMNNLIEVNEDRELYVDLQLPDGIEPDDDFPVGITTGRILAEDWWQQSGTIINSKTTSWDYVRLIYANDWNLYYDPWTWEWIMIGTATVMDVNTKTFFVSSENDYATLLAVANYYISGKNPLICYKNQIYTLQRVFDDLTEDGFMDFSFINTVFLANVKNGKRDENPETLQPFLIRWIGFRVEWGEITNPQFATLDLDDYLVATTGNKAQTVTWTKTFSTSPIVPSKSTPAGNNSTTIATESQVYLKQDKLTAWTNITIDPSTNTISANVQWALVYKWSVQDTASLPSSWNTVGDVYYVEDDWLMYAWDWIQWTAVGNTQIDLSNYFNMTVNSTDNITEGSTNLFVTQAMIDAWNWKQWALTAGTNIQINSWVISATDTTYSAGTWIWMNGTVINNTAPFSPENAGTLGQVLKKTSTGIRRANAMTASWATFWAFITECSQNGTKHETTIKKYSSSSWDDLGTASYTMQWNGFFNIRIYSARGSTASVSINGETIIQKTSSVNVWSYEVREIYFVTVSQGDVITVSLDQYSWLAQADITDYY